MSFQPSDGRENSASVALTSTIESIIATLSLEAGSWMILTQSAFLETAATVTRRLAQVKNNGVSVTGASVALDIPSLTLTGEVALPPIITFLTLTETRTITLRCSATFAAGSVSVFGILRARRQA